MLRTLEGSALCSVLADRVKEYLEEYLRMGHKKLWWYIEQNDYNLYYAENQVSTRYRDFEKEVQV